MDENPVWVQIWEDLQRDFERRRDAGASAPSSGSPGGDISKGGEMACVRA